MANRINHPLWSVGQNRIVMGGTWYPNGTGAITISDGVTAPSHGGFFTARTGVGTYTLTLRDKYFAVLDVNTNLILQTPTNQTIKVISIPRPQPQFANTFVLVAWDPTLNAGAGGAFDPAQVLPSAGGTGNFITFSCIMKNSNIGQAI